MVVLGMAANGRFQGGEARAWSRREEADEGGHGGMARGPLGRGEEQCRGAEGARIGWTGRENRGVVECSGYHRAGPCFLCFADSTLARLVLG